MAALEDDGLCLFGALSHEAPLNGILHWIGAGQGVSPALSRCGRDWMGQGRMKPAYIKPGIP